MRWTSILNVRVWRGKQIFKFSEKALWASQIFSFLLLCQQKSYVPIKKIYSNQFQKFKISRLKTQVRAFQHDDRESKNYFYTYFQFFFSFTKPFLVNFHNSVFPVCHLLRALIFVFLSSGPSLSISQTSSTPSPWIFLSSQTRPFIENRLEAVGNLYEKLAKSKEKQNGRNRRVYK